jgi:hypothetical protein
VDREGLAREGRRRQALEALEFERARGTALQERLEMFVTEIDGPAVDEAIFAGMSADEAAVVRAELQPSEPVPFELDEDEEGESPEDEIPREPDDVLHAAEIERLQREINLSRERQRAFERYLVLLDGDR